MKAREKVHPWPGNKKSDDPIERETCEVQAVVSFYGVQDFLAVVEDASPRSLAWRLFGRNKLDDGTRFILREYSPYCQAKAGILPILLVNGTDEFLWRQADVFANCLEQADAEFELIRLEGAPDGMENWEGQPRWQFYRQAMVDWLKRT